MRNLSFFWFLIIAPVLASAQHTDSTASTSSSWQHVRIQRSSVSSEAVSRVVEFDEPFTDNTNQWPTGQRGSFEYALAQGAYAIRRVGKRDGKSGRVFINLPDSLNLNRASTFVIDVDMVGPKGSAPEGGLLLGVRDEANYNLFVLRGRNEFLLKRVVDGTSSPTYLAGTYQPLDEPIINQERNTLRIEKHDGKLFFAINGQDIPGDPVAFRKFKGNGIGFISGADTVTFQKLRITVGLP